MPSDPTNAALAVEQCDRDAAADCCGRPAEMRGGKMDSHHLVQAFARHRLSALRQQPEQARDAVDMIPEGKHAELLVENARLREALKPFAKAGALAHNCHITAFVYVSDLRRAEAALSAQPAPGVGEEGWPRLTDHMIRSACAAHFGKPAYDMADGLDITVGGRNWTFREFMQRIWPAMKRAALQPKGEG